MRVSRADREELDALRRLAGNTPPLAAMKEWKRAHDLTGGEIIQAATAWAERKKSAHELVTVAQCVKRYLTAKTAAGIQTADNHGHIFNDLTRDMGERMLHEVTSRQLDVWLAKREKPGTRLTYRKWVVALWRWAQKQHYLDRTRLTEAEHTQTVKQPDMEVGIIDAETYGRLLGHFHRLHPDYLPALVLAGFAGMRRSEIHDQKWDDINLAGGHLRVTKGKRGTPSRRLVPLCPAAVEWLMLAPDRTEWVCGNLALDRIRNIARDAKYDLPENCFRHAYISHRVAQTGNIAETSLIAGNSPDIVRRHYLELVTKEAGETWFNLSPAAVAKIEAGGDVEPMPATNGKAGVA
ncbi:MAG: site-specific integrase [Opitutaceae bacterium]|nr:site-specific integrase [Opitutaceae bacterium]